ncbi:MAG: hypothetical protein Q7T81_06415 [Pseudolabrys sp.]|nr:hypothetical protein [Pseudolabrys sp.]
MKLFRNWLRDNRPNYTDAAISLFTRFSERHDLVYKALDAPVEVMWEFPVQERLSLPLTLGLQNRDELNFGAPGFWSYFFPFPAVSENFERYLDAWALGQARIIHRPGRLRITSTSTLEVLTDGKWLSVYSASGSPWPHTNIEIRNFPEHGLM